mgnify:CR=1 FL=1
MILALDLSSSKTGICCMTYDGKIYLFTYLDTQPTTKAKKEMFQDIYDKIQFVTDYFEEYYKAHPESPKITEIHIEGPLSKFTPGKSSMHTLETLFQMNYSVSYELYRIFGIKPKHWHPSTLRSANGLKFPRGSDTKKIVFDFVCNTYPEFKKALPEKLAKNNPWIDVADSVVIARGAWLLGQQNDKS